ncbi:MAG: type II toxin-antitoxin system HigB family toxin [Saprospiraceae bacterium]|nr:type II toxin-antitoxin system HigB family toxin [Saprospiraceae bacterium]
MFNIIARKTLLKYAEMYPEAASALFYWYWEFLKLDINNFNELKMIVPSASIIGDDRVVFNILGNHYRLIVRILFDYKTIQIKWFGTHTEYDKINAKKVEFKK